MYRFRFSASIFSLMIISVQLFAIDVGTSVASVSHEARYQAVGSFTLTISSDDFANASQSTPIYIRFGLNQSNGWGRTRVDLHSESGYEDPINIAIHPVGATVVNPTLPADAVQLVRMIEGERFGWLKITHSSSTWVLDGGGGAAPSSTLSVAMSLGIVGEVSGNLQGSTLQAATSLPLTTSWHLPFWWPITRIPPPLAMAIWNTWT